MNYDQKKQKLIQELTKIKGSIRLAKSTSNLFRYRKNNQNKIDVSNFDQVIFIDSKNLLAEVEGMTTYDTLVKETLKHGLMPAVVPQLKSITVGGAVAGIGIESSSFKYGFVHETILEMEILLSNGKTIICSKNKNKDLFYGFPNSYGTLGYALKIKIKLVPIKKYVKIQHIKFNDAKNYFKSIKDYFKKDIDFIDGTIFNENEMYITIGKFTDDAPFLSDYTYMKIYYKSIQKNKIDYLSTYDYIWRWDTDWFWCSKFLYVQHPLVRLLWGRKNLRSITYQKIRKWSHKYFPARGEALIQDVEIPIDKASSFVNFFHKEIGIKPIWVCPVTVYDKKSNYELYPSNPDELYLNFGFWDTVKSNNDKGFYNKLVERKVEELNGKKSLYSNSYYTENEFWRLYGKSTYDKLKSKYDPSGRFLNLYEKCVMRK